MLLGRTLAGPVTREPWARDEAIYSESRNSVDMRGAGTLSASEVAESTAEDLPAWNNSIVAHPGQPYPS